MFTDYEKLICETCGDEFYGRRPAAFGKTSCLSCNDSSVEPVLDLYDDAPIPREVEEEFDNGKGCS